MNNTRKVTKPSILIATAMLALTLAACTEQQDAAAPAVAPAAAEATPMAEPMAEPMATNAAEAVVTAPEAEAAHDAGAAAEAEQPATRADAPQQQH